MGTGLIENLYNREGDNSIYIFEETQPKIPDINLEELAEIQAKLEGFTSGITKNGITESEAEKLLDWVVYNARKYAVSNTLEKITTASMIGQCALTQNINQKVLTKLGLEANPFNTADCIRENPKTEEDTKKQNEYWKHDVRHSIVLTKIPIMQEDNNTQICEFIIDPTFRQFCLKENCNEEKFVPERWTIYNAVAPHPGFFMQKENLLKLGQSYEYASEAEKLCKDIIYNGYFPLNEQTGKLYGDAFLRASTRLELQSEPIEMRARDYINNFENVSMNTYRSTGEELYTKLPSEIIKSEMTFFKKVAKFFKEKFSKKPKLLPSGKGNDDFEPQKRVNKVETKLTEQDMEKFRIGEAQILKRHENDNDRIKKAIENWR